MGVLLQSLEQGILHIKFNRPDVLNSFNREMALEFQQALDRAQGNSEVRCVVISGEGRAFCAGQDLAEAIDDSGPGVVKIVEEHYNPILKKIRDLQKPILAIVNGVAAGAGANIALACDVVIASSEASFIQAFSKIGLIPDSGGTYTLPRLIGFQRASALMMLGDKVKADEALQMGMLYKVFPSDALFAEGEKIAQTLANLPTKALAFTKALLNESAINSLEAQLKAEGLYQAKASQTEDYKEGVNAFLEKRKPNFKGN
jgi:2-(1,2-epoxy-1,2-dihydrophenyl)acetyl-CoA isomerase